ncbi:D-glutamate cyclase family protein, partial [Rhizobium ruizarguesonis]
VVFAIGCSFSFEEALIANGIGLRHDAEGNKVDIPVNLQALLLARVDRLPQEIRRLAQDAAVVGPKFDTDLLRTIATDPAAIDAALDHLCDANIIEELRGPDAGGSPGYRFSQ